MMYQSTARSDAADLAGSTWLPVEEVHLFGLTDSPGASRLPEGCEPEDDMDLYEMPARWWPAGTQGR
jgi:hypothetical protein